MVIHWLAGNGVGRSTTMRLSSRSLENQEKE